ncbi:hypothetical protein ACFFJX_25225 [Pseudarcicella hirudinis]
MHRRARSVDDIYTTDNHPVELAFAFGSVGGFFYLGLTIGVE